MAAKETLYTESYMKALAKFKESCKEQHEAYKQWHRANQENKVFEPKLRELIMLAVSVGLRCSYCIETHSKKAKAYGATDEEIATVIMLAAQVAAGATISYGIESLKE